MKSRIYPLISIGALALLFLLFYLNMSGYFGDRPMGQTSNATSPLIVPATYAFSIWSILYLGILIFPIYQLFAYNNRHSLWNKVHIWFSINIIANGAWLAFAALDWLWTTVLVMLVLLGTLVKINLLIRQIHSEGGKVNYWIEKLVFSLYFAWITLATALNVSAALDFYEWGAFGISEATWTVIIVLVAAGIAGFVSWKLQDIAYAGVVIWAFVALALKHLNTYPIIAYVAMAIITLFAAFVISTLMKKFLNNFTKQKIIST